MAEVVFESLQHTAREELQAMAVYLRSLPEARAPSADSGARNVGSPATAWLESGAQVYQEHCASCHGANGEGTTAAIALAGNRAITMHSTVNPIRVVLYGGYPPGTAANARPY
jgi:mono/diheme cytochrome c family protein